MGEIWVTTDVFFNDGHSSSQKNIKEIDTNSKHMQTL
jgi:hypothetical protein